MNRKIILLFVIIVIATGTASEVTEDEERVLALSALCRKLLPDNMGDSFDMAVSKSLPATSIWRIDLDEISGKAKKRK